MDNIIITNENYNLVMEYILELTSKVFDFFDEQEENYYDKQEVINFQDELNSMSIIYNDKK